MEASILRGGQRIELRTGNQPVADNYGNRYGDNRYSGITDKAVQRIVSWRFSAGVANHIIKGPEPGAGFKSVPSGSNPSTSASRASTTEFTLGVRARRTR